MTIKLDSVKDVYRVCAWCGRHMGGKLTKGCVFTHGICEACEEKLRREAGLGKRKEKTTGERYQRGPCGLRI